MRVICCILMFILVFSHFAESLECQVHKLDIKTHIFVLRTETHLAPCIQDLTAQGILYAFILNQENETHESCTLRLLQGTPQEHRNMHLSDALQFLARTHDNHLQSLKEAAAAQEQLEAASQALMPPGFVPPSAQESLLLHLLADCRMMTVPELQRILDFVIMRRDRVAAVQTPSEDKMMDDVIAAALGTTVEDRDLQSKIQTKLLTLLAAPNNTLSGGGSTFSDGAVAATLNTTVDDRDWQSKFQTKLLTLLAAPNNSLSGSSATYGDGAGIKTSSSSAQLQQAISNLMLSAPLKLQREQQQDNNKSQYNQQAPIMNSQPIRMMPPSQQLNVPQIRAAAGSTMPPRQPIIPQQQPGYAPMINKWNEEPYANSYGYDNNNWTTEDVTLNNNTRVAPAPAASSGWRPRPF